MTAIGRPTRFEPEMCEQAHNYCLLGATNDELAEFFDVSPSTIDRWIAERADFRDAVRSGRVAADARGARGLYARAVGYDRTFERSVVIGCEVKPVTSTIHYPPNVQACIFWLRNRRRRTWSDPGRDGPDNPSATPVDDIALLDAASESMRLERKDDMRKRGLASPDDGDALALTFAYPVGRRNWEDERRIQEQLALRTRCYL